MSKLLGEKIFDAVFSSLSCVDWHLDGWSGVGELRDLCKEFLLEPREMPHLASFGLDVLAVEE